MRQNSFSLDMRNESKYPSAYLSMGVFITASYINHSCLAKAARSFIGDMSIVCAEYDMRAGTELTIQYFNSRTLGTPQVHVDKRTEKVWDFKCDCRLCAMARAMQNDLVVEIEDLLTMYISVCSDVVQKSVNRELTKEEYAVYKRVMIKIGRLMGIWDTQVPEGFETVPRLSLAPDHDDFMPQCKSELGGDPERLIQAAYKGLVQDLGLDIVKQGHGEAHAGSNWNRGWRVFEVKRWGVVLNTQKCLDACFLTRAWKAGVLLSEGERLKESGMMAQKYVAICQHIRRDIARRERKLFVGSMSW